MSATNRNKKPGAAPPTFDAELGQMASRHWLADHLMEENRQQALDLAPEMIRAAVPGAVSVLVKLASEYRGLDEHPVAEQALDDQGYVIPGGEYWSQQVIDRLVDFAGTDLWAEAEDILV